MRIIGLALVVVMGIAGIGAGAGAAAAQGLPSRKGMSQIVPGLWIDSNATPEEVAAIRERINKASAKVLKYMGDVQAVEWWICASPECNRANGMKARGMTYGASLITLDANASRDGGVYVHELTHATLHGALPMGGLFSKALPLWFDEGVAVILSQQPPEAAQKSACTKPQKGALPRNALEFNRLAPDAKRALPVYTRSACAVRDWLAEGRKLKGIVPMLRAGRHLP
ncbi:hypothetical protein [Gemmobacter serpentinus]|uniref:hypothetical protein n=1 Tax=Gemmobacter serpentinus TaxID=2652247 RepID=UPI00124C5D81|nr:hypothetical protein [Gemmobacter serpentinus]